MENATKALLMAGGILIGIMIATFMVLVLHKGGQMSAEHDSQLSDQTLLDFNSQFEVYNVPDNDFFDVITVVNLAYDVNAKSLAGDGIIVEINAGAKTYRLPDDDTKTEKNKMWDGSTPKDIYAELIPIFAPLQDSGKRKYKFPCTAIEYSQATGRVNKMIFKQENN